MDIETIKNNPVKLESKFSTALTYLVVGLFLATFNLNIGYLEYLQPIASAICFFLGLRLIKNLNTSLKWAYYISIYFLIALTILSVLQMVSPIVEYTNFIYMNLFVNIIKIILIGVGLNGYINSHQNIKFVTLYLFTFFIVIMFQSENLSFAMFIVSFIILFLPMRSLWKCRQEIIQNHNDMVLKSPKIQSSIFIGGWAVLTLILSMSLPYIWPYFTYDYVEPIEEENYESIAYESNQFKFINKATVYETKNEEYKIVLEYQQDDRQGKYSLMDIQYGLSNNRGVSIYTQPQYITVSDENGTLQSQVIVNQQPEGVFFSNTETTSQRFYLNPLSKNIKVSLVVTVPKAIFGPIENEDEEEIEAEPFAYCSLKISRYKYGSFSDDVERTFENLRINKDGKIDRNA